MATVNLRQVRKTFEALEVVHGVDLDVADQEFVVLVGPSGCGKSTLLRMIAGLEEVSAGEIRIGERLVNEVDPRERVAMGRAIVREPKVFLFDEPLSNLDAKLRVQMRTEIKKLRERVRTTAIYVTHDQVEAMTLADRIVLMNKGRVEQVGTPEDVYEQPATLFVAGFVGTSTMNLVPGRIDDDACAAVLGSGVRLALPPARYAAHAGRPVTIGLRPEHLHWAEEPEAGALLGTARVVEPLGSDTLVVFDAAGCELQARLAPRRVRRAGDAVRVAIAPESIHLFDPGTERRL